MTPKKSAPPSIAPACSRVRLPTFFPQQEAFTQGQCPFQDGQGLWQSLKNAPPAARGIFPGGEREGHTLRPAGALVFPPVKNPPRSGGTFAYGCFAQAAPNGNTPDAWTRTLRFIFISLWKRCEKHRLTFYTFVLIVK
jgi:hypothetical protein